MKQKLKNQLAFLSHFFSLLTFQLWAGPPGYAYARIISNDCITQIVHTSRQLIYSNISKNSTAIRQSREPNERQ